MFEINREVTLYNDELHIKFINGYLKKIRKSGYKSKQQEELIQNVDLIKAINSYRRWRNYEDLLKVQPDLEDQRQYMVMLWNHFSGLSEEGLCDLWLEMVNELDLMLKNRD